MALEVTDTPPLDGYGVHVEPPSLEYSFLSESELNEAVRTTAPLVELVTSAVTLGEYGG